jgi:hypothetical protein
VRGEQHVRKVGRQKLQQTALLLLWPVATLDQKIFVPGDKVIGCALLNGDDKIGNVEEGRSLCVAARLSDGSGLTRLTVRASNARRSRYKTGVSRYEKNVALLRDMAEIEELDGFKTQILNLAEGYIKLIESIDRWERSLENKSSSSDLRTGT